MASACKPGYHESPIRALGVVDWALTTMEHDTKSQRRTMLPVFVCLRVSAFHLFDLSHGAETLYKVLSRCVLKQYSRCLGQEPDCEVEVGADDDALLYISFEGRCMYDGVKAAILALEHRIFAIVEAQWLPFGIEPYISPAHCFGEIAENLRSTRKSRFCEMESCTAKANIVSLPIYTLT